MAERNQREDEAAGRRDTQPARRPDYSVEALRRFYMVESDADLIAAQQQHVHALQFKLRWFAPSFAYAPPTPLEKTP